MLADSLTCLLDGHIGKLSEGQTFLAAHVAVSMLEKLPSSLADSQLQSDTFGITVYCFTAFAVGVIGWNRFDGSLCERKSFVHSGLLE